MFACHSDDCAQSCARRPARMPCTAFRCAARAKVRGSDRSGHADNAGMTLMESFSKAKGRALALRLGAADRKSTRLNSSHLVISYAVFCLKKKNYASLKVRDLLLKL